MKLLGLNFYCIDWERLYRNRTKQYRETRRQFVFSSNREKVLEKAVNLLNAENGELLSKLNDERVLAEKRLKENECLKALVDSLREDELAIRNTALEDENKALSKRISKFEEDLKAKREKNAETARKHREARKRQKLDPACVDLDVLLYDARQLGYDLEVKQKPDGEPYFTFISRESGSVAFSFRDIGNAIAHVNKLKKDLYGE